MNLFNSLVSFKLHEILSIEISDGLVNSYNINHRLRTILEILTNFNKFLYKLTVILVYSFYLLLFCN